MEHKGLNYTFSVLAVVSIMIAIIAYSLDGGGSRVFILDTFPSKSSVYLNGKPIGQAPVRLDSAFLKRRGISGIEAAPLLRIFTPRTDGTLLIESSGAAKQDSGQAKPPAPQVLTFALPTPAGQVPQVFEKATPGAKPEAAQKSMGAFIYFDKTDKMIVVFDHAKMPRLSAEEKERANVLWFGGDIELSAMAQYKSFKQKSPAGKK
ncbi:MAG: hypothetical protein IKS15_03865 [Opitutales bacterium]|nr:hypothetical protein [Opitutales bacterium]